MGSLGGIKLALVGIATGLAGFFVIPKLLVPQHSEPSVEGRPLFSLLAVGDTGKRHRWPRGLRAGQMVVAQGVNAEDERFPVDALLLLGDNFYMNGLSQSELISRVRENVALPYCRFVELAGPRSDRMSDACEPRTPLRKLRFLAVLGNHDVDRQESIRLQREAVPQFISNWHVITGCAEVVELGPDVSLVLADSTLLCLSEGAGALVQALQSARGPWRILAAHHPINVQDDGGPAPRGEFTRIVQRAISVAGVRVQLALAGHLHSMQVLHPAGPGPSLTVIAGSGSSVRPIPAPHPDRLFEATELGFARVELLERAEGPVLVVSLFRTPRIGAVLGAGPELLSRWVLKVSGQVRPEL